jgi:hypothetical protein
MSLRLSLFRICLALLVLQGLAGLGFVGFYLWFGQEAASHPRGPLDGLAVAGAFVMGLASFWFSAITAACFFLARARSRLWWIAAVIPPLLLCAGVGAWILSGDAGDEPILLKIFTIEASVLTFTVFTAIVGVPSGHSIQQRGKSS